MNSHKMNTVVAMGAFSLLLLAACENTTGSDSKADVDADLKVLATKVKYMSSPAAGLADKGPEGAAPLSKRAVDCYNGSVDGVLITNDTDTDHRGNPVNYIDTVRYYTAQGTLACGEADVIAYETSNSYSKDALTEFWMKTRTDNGAPGSAYLFKFTGTGKVHYFSGYDIVVTSMDISVKPDFSMSAYIMNLSLEDGRYTVALTLAPGADFSDEPKPEAVMVSGPIKQGAATVGYFEIMGDDRVVIRDAAKNIVAVK